MKYQSEALKTFSAQINFALEHYTGHTCKSKDFDNVIICGLGGSGIGGTIAKNFFTQHANLPIEVVSDYDIPAYVSDKTLAIVSSYSGNTEETLSMYHKVIEKKAKVLVISSGGKITQLANQGNFPIYAAVPGCQPRMALGYSLSYVLLALGDFFGINFKTELKEISELVANDGFFFNQASELFFPIKKRLKNKTIIVSDGFLDAVAVRFAQQVQENAKSEAFVSVLPEANHNMIETYHSEMPTNFIFLNSFENHRVNKRFEFLKNLLVNKGNVTIEVGGTGSSLKHIFGVIYTLDWLSLLMADGLSRQSDHVPIISDLKNYLAEA
jgi:glucose/mannose-6-phosphate isomerase